MSKLFIILGIVACSLLFFLSGTFTGYIIGEAPRDVSISDGSEKPKRIPSTKNPILGRVISSQQSNIMGKVRRPSTPALDRARSYQNTPVQ